MDREYLENYEHKENEEYDRFIKRIREGKFRLGKGRFPSDKRFVKLQRPVALTTLLTAGWSDIWAQVPFSGSLILKIAPFTKSYFEKLLFKVSEIPKIIDFIKETGRLQVVLSTRPLAYETLDYLDLFFKELKPPVYSGVPVRILGTEKEVESARHTFSTLARVRFSSLLKKIAPEFGPTGTYERLIGTSLETYTSLKLGRYAVAEDIENLMIDDPSKALKLFRVCGAFIVNPLHDTCVDTQNLSLEDIHASQALPDVYQPEEMKFPCEIGKFLFEKLTLAPMGMRACYDIIDHYEAYDLQKVQKSLNEAIVANHPDIVEKSAKDLSESLDNVWADKTIPKRIENIKVGVPVSIAAIGGIAGGLVGGLAGVGTGGFLAGLGFKVAEKAVEKFFTVKGEGLSERIAKLRTKSYQANVYDFKKKYKGKIVQS